MKIYKATTAVFIATMVGPTVVAAESHVDVMAVTCAEFVEMEISDQESMIVALGAAVEEVDVDDTTIGEIEVLCNGSEEEAVAELLDDDG